MIHLTSLIPSLVEVLLEVRSNEQSFRDACYVLLPPFQFIFPVLI